jgi:NADPH:quinone reductase-like Zn-dependent oxidoreductase
VVRQFRDGKAPSGRCISFRPAFLLRLHEPPQPLAIMIIVSRTRGRPATGLSVDAALDLVGTPTLPDTLRAVRVHGTACFGGSLSNQWTVRDFSPNEYLPKGVRLAGYFGDAADLPREAFGEILDAVAAGRLSFSVDRVYDGLEQVPQAHDDMEHNRVTGKLVVRVRH